MTSSAGASGSPRIRPAVPGDAPAAARVRYAFRAELGTPTEPEEAFVARCAAWMAERLASGAWRGWIAEDGAGAIVGQAWMQLVEKMPNPVDEAELHAYVTNCYVLPGMRGGGIGSALLDVVLRACREARVDSVFLWPSARARPLYLRHGFAVHDDLLELRLAAR